MEQDLLRSSWERGVACDTSVLARGLPPPPPRFCWKGPWQCLGGTSKPRWMDTGSPASSLGGLGPIHRTSPLCLWSSGRNASNVNPRRCLQRQMHPRAEHGGGPADDIHGVSLTSISAALKHFTRCNRCEVPDVSQPPGADPLTRLESGRQRGGTASGCSFNRQESLCSNPIASFLTSDLVLEKSADLFEINPLVVRKHTL